MIHRQLSQILLKLNMTSKKSSLSLLLKPRPVPPSFISLRYVSAEPHIDTCSRTTSNTHIFLIPRLCTVHYRKQLLKCCDVVLTIDCMHPFWDTNMFEPILMGIRLPLLPPERRFCPWQFKHTKLVEELQLQMRRVQSTSEPVNWDFLREFLLQTGTIRSMPDGVARKLLQTAPRRSLSNSKTKGNGRRG